MKIVTSLLFVALLVASAFADCVTRGPVDSYVGDHAVLDSVVECSGQQQSIALPATQLGGHDALTFEVEVFPRAFTGCVFSYGSLSDGSLVALSFAQDPNNQLGQVKFTIGSTSVSTEGVVTPNAWHSIAVVVSKGSATIYVDAVRYTPAGVSSISSAPRSGTLGMCSNGNTYFNGAIDNLIVSATEKSLEDIKDTHNLIYPFVLENDLVQMWTFNDDGTTTAAYTGNAAENVAVASLAASTVSSGTPAPVCSRAPKAKFTGARVASKFCQQSGSVVVASGSSVDSIQNVAPFQTAEGGYSRTFACNDGESFVFNQKWANGGITEVTIKTSLNHRFRVQANPGAPINVYHQAWGGWTLLSVGSGIIAEDRSAYSISEAEFVIQAAGLGWIAVSQNAGFLNYQYALVPAACPAATCEFSNAEEYQYSLQDPPLPEPMGNQDTTQGIQNLPPVLACPPPVLNGYNPFMYCWGWWVGPKVGYVKDWNGNPWQTSDPGCCRNPAILDGQWSYRNWGYMVAGKTLPWCDNMVVPPTDPPKGTTAVPTYPTDPCEGISASDLTAFKSTCANLWGSDQTDGRYLGCVAQLCITQDPNTVPPPDCKTEKLLAQLDNTHVVPSTCNSCPGNCNFRGTCDANSLTCTSCQSGWAGPDCGQPTTYPCWTADGLKVIPFQLTTLDPKFPDAPVLTQTMTDPIYTQFAFPGKFQIADTLFIYVTQSIESYGSNNAQYHLWAVSNNLNGAANVDYQVTITATGFSTSGAQVDLLPSATYTSSVSGTSASGSIYPNLDRNIVSDTIKLRLTHTGSQRAGFVIRKLPNNFSATISLAGYSSGRVIPQVLIGGTSSSQKAKMDVIKISASSVTNGFQIGGGVCSNPANLCANLGCADCAANTQCGWCVETAQCTKGDATGPAFGECLNWRFTFDSAVSRRVTQIPAYPVNPGLTEVYLSASSDLPIEVGLTPYAYAQSEWDTVILTDFSSVPSAVLSGDLGGLLTKAMSFPNFGLSLVSINAGGYELVIETTNPNANDKFRDAINNKKWVSTNNVDGALAQLANTDDLSLRRGTRKLALFVIRQAHDGVSSISSAVAQALLTKNIMPVFSVPENLKATYQAIVAQLGFGYVIGPANYALTLDNALSIAGSSISITIPAAEQTTTHIDYTAFSTNMDRFSVINLPSNFRAKFKIPVHKNAGVADVATTHLVFPGYGNAVVENIPSARAEKPWTTMGGQLSLLDDQTNTVIELTGMSFRGLMAVTPRITAISDFTKGNFYRAVRKLVNGAPAWVAGDLIASIPAGGLVIADGRIVFVPTTATTTDVVLTYEVFDRCISSASGTISIKIDHSNTAPVADMPNLVTPQYTPLEFDLGFGDDKKSSGAPYSYTIVDTVNFPDDGAIYQYYANFDPTNPDDNKRVLSGQTVSQNRFIYMPPQYKYSDATRAELLTLPCFVYKVAETTESPNLESNEKQVLITVTHVNVRPFVWRAASWPSALLGDWVDTYDHSFCGENADAVCTWLEDFGEQYWWNTGFEKIYLGGNDVEGSDLVYEITLVDCFPGASIKMPLDTINDIKVGDKIYPRQQAGTLNPTLNFRPARETSDETRLALDGANYYCKIGYRVVDTEEAVSDEKIITIHITNVNKQPRLDDEVSRFVVREQLRQGFYVTALDPEDDAFTITFRGCAKNQGTVEFCKNFACDETVTLDCSNIYDAANPTAININLAIATGEKIDGTVQPIQGYFTSGDINTYIEGQEYNTIYLTLDDGVSTFPASHASIIFDVKLLNRPPVLSLQGDDTATELNVAPALGEDFLFDLDVSDPDFTDDVAYIMTVEGSLDNSKTPSARFDVDGMSSALFVCKDAESFQISETAFKLSCTIGPVRDLLRAVKVLAPQVLADGEGEVIAKVSVTDNGWIGQCDIDYLTNAPCPLEDSVTVTLTYTPAGDNSMVTVASSAAAAGVAGAAAIAAVALFRKLNKKAEESYQPWESNEDEDATAVNPLYQESGSKGVNALYEAKNQGL